MSNIAIIIVNWNTGELLADCLKSLLALDSEERSMIAEVVVVDNSSTDASFVKAEVVKGEAVNQLKIHFLRMETNLGFAAANNYGIRWVLEHAKSVPHVLLLNPDTQVRPGAIATMLNTLESKGDVGVVGPHLVNADGTTQKSVRNFPTFFTLLLYMLKLGWLWEKLFQQSFDYTLSQYVDQVMGAAFLMRNKMIEVVHGLDEGYFLWFEEVDCCKHALSHGFKTYYVAEADIVHYGGVSFHQLIGLKKTLPWLSSTLHYAKKHFSTLEWLILVAISPVSVLLSFPAAMMHIRLRRQTLRK